MRRKDFLALRLGKPRRITAVLTHHEHPAVAPGGTWLAYYAGEFGSIEILVGDMQGRTARRASPFSGNSTQPAWHPDGRRIAYRHQHTTEAKWEIWETTLLPEEDPGLRSAKPKAQGKAKPASGATEPAAEPAVQAAAAPPVDTQPRRLLADPRYDYKHPCYSPDGSRIVYFSDEGSPGVFHLWLLEAATGERLQLTFGARQNHCHPAYSPDGTRIAFHAYEIAADSDAAPVTNLYELALHTGEVQQLTDRADQDKHPFYLDDTVLTFHHESNADGKRGVRALHLKHGLEAVLTDGDSNDKHPFPWFDGAGVAHLAWASKKLGSEREGEASTYDIFIAPFKRG
jgi:dipeptidyl aminopeptidase/acylaminoacyl peptidase